MLSIGNKKYRNLQEQVGYNTEQIEEIQAYLDGISLDDKLVVISSTSGTLTDEEYGVVAKKLAFMATSSDVYIKSEEDASDIVFRQVKLVATAIGTTNFEIGTNKITVSKLTKAYVGSTDSVLAVYSKDQIDTLLSSKADTTYVDTELAKKANLAGANFTGNITAPTITENARVYTFQKDTSGVISYAYAGICKNGNKITFAIAGTLNFPDSIPVSKSLATIILPTDIWDKLYPMTYGGSNNILSVKPLLLFANENQSYSFNVRFTKSNYTGYVVITLYPLGSADLSINTDYVFRYEETFLLSENLAS